MIPIAKVIVSPTEPQGKNRKKVWMQKGKNLFNKNNIENILYSSGAIVANQTSWGMSEFIEVSGSTKYTMSSTLISGQTVGQIQINEFDENKNYNSDTFLNVTTLEFTTKSNTKYLRVAYRIDRQENVMLEQGSKTSYEPYIEPTIYIKNSNDVYEEFIKKENIKKISFTKNDANNIYYYSMYATENEVQINADVRYSFSDGTHLKAFTIEKQYLPLIFSESEGQLKFPVTTDYQTVGYAIINSNGEVYIHTNGQSKAAIINIRYRYK